MIISQIKRLLLNRHVSSLIIGSIATFFIFFYRHKLKNLKDHQTSSSSDVNQLCSSSCLNCSDSNKTKLKIILLYGSQTNTVRKLALELFSILQNRLKQLARISFYNIIDYDVKGHFLKLSKLTCNNYLFIILISTHQDGQIPDNCKKFYQNLEQASFDAEVTQTFLKDSNYCIFGVGDSEYSDTFCQLAQNLDFYLSSLKISRFINTIFCDTSKNKSVETQFNKWSHILLSQILKSFNKDYIETEKNEIDRVNKVVDIEDVLQSLESELNLNEMKEMITPSLRVQLTKQGYKLIGSHSGVKLCRWTKSTLRGRGGCYNHTFYGLDSHRCMETTSCLACANRCVFCWRHHANPVGTKWKWLMDEPDFIAEEAIKNHCKMIKEFKGASGVINERYYEGMNVKHCALSLVGEPILYPKINVLIRKLHQKNISTFLVTNAQFPEAIKNLEPVTQLYISIDAASEKSLKKIDRPLFKDFWRRLINSLKELSKKDQRTVYRLTLVKSWNIDEIEGYAKLISIGDPDFIEIKGVTYCGTGKDTKLTMSNVPWHQEVISFVEKLVKYVSDDYEIASEHEASLCVLVAKKKFKINGKWKTWIDYDKFHLLVNKYYQTSSEFKFNSLDYASYLPEWAVFGAKEKGFDPFEKKHFRKNKTKILNRLFNQEINFID